jgi:hypothetical protein
MSQIKTWTEQSQDIVQLPRVSRRTYPSHGDEVCDGALGGQTDTDYFYFMCPACGQMMQAEPIKVVTLKKAPGYVLHIGLYCQACHLTDLTKIPVASGWRGGTLSTWRVDYLWKKTPTGTNPSAPTREPSTRSSLSPKQRFALFLSYGFRCVYCGRSPADGIKLQVEHLVAKANGGPDHEENYVPACRECNIGKGTKEIL